MSCIKHGFLGYNFRRIDYNLKSQVFKIELRPSEYIKYTLTFIIFLKHSLNSICLKTVHKGNEKVLKEDIERGELK